MNAPGAAATSGTFFVQVGDLTLHARRDGWGNPGPTLLYLHSLGSDLRIWDGVVARLPGRRHLRVDLRGHGLSDAPAGPYRMADLAGDALGVIDALGIDEVIAVGISIGGMAVLQLALAAPERVRAVVGCDTSSRIGDAAKWEARIAEVRERGLAAMSAELVQGWLPAAYRAAVPEAARGYATMLTRTPSEGYLGACAALRDADLGPALGVLELPALVLTGSEDVSTPPAVGRALAAALSGSFVEVDGAAHLPCIDRPDEVAAALRSFLERTGHG